MTTARKLATSMNLADQLADQAGRVIHRNSTDAMHAYEDEGPRYRQAGTETMQVVLEWLIYQLATSHPAQPLLRGLRGDLRAIAPSTDGSTPA